MPVEAVATGTNTTIKTQQRKDQKQEVATGVGAAAGMTKAATSAAGKRGLASEKTLSAVLDNVTMASKNVTKTTEEVTGLWSKFKLNIGKYTQDIISRLDGLKDMKIIGPLVKSPITKGIASIFGGALAFFVLVTGLNRAVQTGAIAVNDFKNQYHDLVA